MKKTNDKDALVLTIPPELVNALGIEKDTPLEMIVAEGALIIRPQDTKKAKQQRQKKLIESANNLASKYEALLKKLAKT